MNNEPVGSEEVGVDFIEEGVFSVFISDEEKGSVKFSASKEKDGFLLIEFSENVKKINDSILHVVVDRITEDTKKQMILLLKDGKHEVWYTRYFQDDCILEKNDKEKVFTSLQKHLHQDIKQMLNVEDNLHWARALWDHLRDMDPILFPQEE